MVRDIAVVLVAITSLVSCGPERNDVSVVYEDGSQLSVEGAIDSELRAAMMALETAYTTEGSYSGDTLADSTLYEPVHDVEIRPVRVDAQSYCLEGHAAGVVRHIASGDVKPQPDACPR